MKENKNVPEIRFEGFTGEWEEVRLGELATLRNDKVDTHTYKIDVELENILPKEGKLVGDLSIRTSSNLTFESGDVIFGKLRPYLEKYWYATCSGIRSGETWALVATKHIDSQFLFNLVRTKKFIARASLTTGTKMPRADWKLMSVDKYEIPKNIKEQQAIGQYFEKLDSLISLHQVKHQKLLDLKKSMLYKLFPKEGETVPEIRFEGFNGEWEEVRLGDMVSRIVRKNTNSDSTLPLTISAQYGLVDQITYFNNRVASSDLSNYYLVINGEFAYNKSTSEGFPFGVVKRLDLYEKGALSTLYIVFSIQNHEEINSDFLKVYFDTDLWHKSVSERASERARNHGLLNISVKDFFDTKLCLPKLKEEQQVIGQYFSKLDEIIDLNKQKIDKLKNIKAALLDKMFV